MDLRNRRAAVRMLQRGGYRALNIVRNSNPGKRSREKQGQREETDAEPGISIIACRGEANRRFVVVHSSQPHIFM